MRDSIENLSSTLDILRHEAFIRALLFIAKFQPLGRQLQFVEAFMDVCYDVYRISRYCREIGRVDSIVGNLASEHFRDLYNGLRWAKSMVELAVQSFIENNKEYAKRVLEMDSRLDKLYESHLERLASVESVPSYYAAKIVVARHVERIGDHATYIASYTLMFNKQS